MRIHNVLRNIIIFGILIVIAFALYFPVQDQYGNENNQGRSVHETHKHTKASAVKKPHHSATKYFNAGKIVMVLFAFSCLLILRVPKPHLPYRPTILLRLRLIILTPIKFTSTYV